MSINYEMAKYTELTGEDGTKVPISRLGGFLDGYEKGRTDVIAEVLSNINMYRDRHNNSAFSKYDIEQMIKIVEQLKQNK